MALVLAIPGGKDTTMVASAGDLRLHDHTWCPPRMSVYSEMLRIALASDPEPSDSLPDLVSRAVRLRLSIRQQGDAATRLGDTLAYDMVLVRLCDLLGIAHGLVGYDAGPVARRQAESELVAQLPSLSDLLTLE